MITHTPDNDLLLDYATGALPEPMALAVATHAALCLASAHAIERLEAVGGAMLDSLEPAALRQSALAAVLDRLDEDASPEAAAEPDETTRAMLPRPMWRYVPNGLDALKWRRKGPMAKAAALQTGSPDYAVRLLRIRAGRPVPRHTHRGREITLTLAGGYSDGRDHFERGDFQLADPSIEHQPVADPGEDCLCLVVLEAPIRLTGRLGRLIDPFVSI